jgi:formylglycine-generating enzyme required for sulfatase activity
MQMHLAVNSTRLFVCILAVICLSDGKESRSDELDKSQKPAADSIIGKEPGQVRDDNGLKLKLVWCPPGKFTMGSPPSEKERDSNEDQVDVSLTNGFWLGKYEVTQWEWKRVMRTTPWKDKELTKEGADFPATFISWDQAILFCKKLTLQERSAGRVPETWMYTLPTEAEWEYACRAGTTTPYSSGDDPSQVDSAWCAENTVDVGEAFAHRIGQKKPNAWGLNDMHANVQEWCLDRYVPNLLGGTDPEGNSETLVRVIRGGAWTNAAVDCRSAFRSRGHPSVHDECLGFRVALRAVRQAKPVER